MNEDPRKSFWVRELERGMSAFVVAPVVLLVTPSVLVPLLPGRLGLVFVLSLVASIVSYLAVSRRRLFGIDRDPLELGGWKALMGWLILTSLVTGLVSFAWK